MEIKSPITIFNLEENNVEIPQFDDLFKVLVLSGIIEKREKWDVYNFNGASVPRVSEILKETIGKDYLLKWALNLGKEAYNRESVDTLLTGTLVHEMIEHFLLYGVKKEVQFRSYNMKRKTEQCYFNFLSWYRNMINMGYEITPVAIEQEISCPWFGGTIDCVMNIKNDSIGYNKTFITDFKSSKKISIEYFLQTYAYFFAYEWNRTYIDPSIPELDGVGIIRIDKESNKYEDRFLSYNSSPEEDAILNDIRNGLFSMIDWYYHIINLNYNLGLTRKIGGFKDGKY